MNSREKLPGIVSIISIVILTACGNATDPIAIMSDADWQSDSLLEISVATDVPVDRTGPGDTGIDWAELADWFVDIDVGLQPGHAGHPCDGDDECNSGFCISTPDGKKCTCLCEEECPFGWQCVLHTAALPDEVYICAPLFMNLCRPCKANSDCRINGVDSGDTCVSYGEPGNFCGGACHDVNCPQAYECLEIEDVAQGLSLQCVLVDGECACAEWFVDENATTSCYHENEWGKCDGDRACTAQGLSECTAAIPAKEQCNNVDDDCDGMVDEDTGGAECFVSNEYGACPGHEKCINGETECDAPEPAIEACDGADNNCDGQTDEGYPDTDNDGTADCLEVDKDNDEIEDSLDNCPLVFNPGQKDFDLDGNGDLCDLDDDNDLVPDEDDCEPWNPGINPYVEEACNGKDDNCNLLVDEGFPDSDADKFADCIDEDDDNDGFVDEADCQALDPTSNPAADEVCDGKDNDCDGQVDEGFPDTDGDGSADCMEEDADNDGVGNSDDNCPLAPNPEQEDLDNDGIGDACDDDKDGDGLKDPLDNCELVFNPAQADLDADGQGDLCDVDMDGDDIPNDSDNCPSHANGGQEDLDQDGQGDTCDDDDDDDGWNDQSDNCPYTANPDQQDLDKDGVGDACENDTDGDLVPDEQDNCPLHANPDQQDCDNDGAGALCDDDDDADGTPDPKDNCLCLSNPGQTDLDEDGIGDACDPDKDGDGLANGLDNCPVVFNPAQLDKDQDGTGDDCDDDLDGDGTVNADDNCPKVANAQQADLDGDKVGNACDEDDDGDSDPDVSDCAPLDPEIHNEAEELCDGVDNNCDQGIDEGFPDSDFDGFKDCVDNDDDGDGDPDDEDCEPLNPWIHTNADELCNGQDDNCNEQVDEGFAILECGKGECHHFVPQCKDGDVQFCNPYEGIAVESCDQKDNDCDGLTDEDYELDLLCTVGLGQCLAEGLTVCSNDGQGVVCNAEPGQEQPEMCDGLDNDCDGQVDEDAADCSLFYKDMDGDGWGMSDDSVCLCSPEPPYDAIQHGDCDDGDPNLVAACNLVGTGQDGPVNFEGDFDLNRDMSPERTKPDGVAWKVLQQLDDTTVVLEATSGLAKNDIALVIALQGAGIAVGSWQLCKIADVQGNNLTLLDPLKTDYQPGLNVVVVQRVPQYQDVALGGSLTASAFDGLTSGDNIGRATGIVAVRAKKTLTVSPGAEITVVQRGFRGAATGAGPEGASGILSTGGIKGVDGGWADGGAGGGTPGPASGGKGAASCSNTGGPAGKGGGGGGGKITHCAGGYPAKGGGGGGGGAAHDALGNDSTADLTSLLLGGGASAGASGGKSGANAGSGTQTAPGGTPNGGAAGQAGGGMILIWAHKLIIENSTVSANAGSGGKGGNGENKDGPGHDDGGGGGGEGGQGAAGGALLLAAETIDASPSAISALGGAGGNGGKGGLGWSGGGAGTGGIGASPGGLPTNGGNATYQNDGGAPGGGGAGGQAGSPGAIRIVFSKFNGNEFGTPEAETEINGATDNTCTSFGEWKK